MHVHTILITPSRKKKSFTYHVEVESICMIGGRRLGDVDRMFLLCICMSILLQKLQLLRQPAVNTMINDTP